MNSNTKLFPEQKQYVKDFENQDNGFFFHNNETTVLVKPEFNGSRMFIVSMSTMSPDEKKFRKYVGRYFALSNMENGQYVLMNKDTLYAFLDNNKMFLDDEGFDNAIDVGLTD